MSLYKTLKRKIGGKPSKNYTHSGGEAERKGIAETEYEAQVSLPDVPIFPLEDLAGRGIVTVPYDRTRAGTVITNIEGVDLKQPVDYHGGQDYMVESSGVIGASSPTKIKMLNKAAADIEKKTGKPALFLPNRMEATGGDFSRMPVETMVQYAYSNMGRDGIKELNAAIKTIIPEFKGLGSKQGMNQIRNASGDQKKALASVMHIEFKDKGGLTRGQARALSTAPNQLEGTTTGFQNVGEFDLSRGDQGLIPFSGHTDYPAAAAGEVVGRLDPENLAFYDLFTKQAEKRGVTDPRNLNPKDRRSAQMNVPRSTIVTDKKLEDILKKIAQGTITTGMAGKVFASDGQSLPQFEAEEPTTHAAQGKIDRVMSRKNMESRAKKFVDRLGFARGIEAASAYNEAMAQMKADAKKATDERLYAESLPSWDGYGDEVSPTMGFAADTMDRVNENLPELLEFSSLAKVLRDAQYGKKSDPIDLGVSGLESDVGAAGAVVALPMIMGAMAKEAKDRYKKEKKAKRGR